MNFASARIATCAQLVILAAIAVHAVDVSPAQAASAIEAYRQAHETVSASLVAHGGLAPLREAGGVVIRTNGSFDLATRLQGRSPARTEPTPIAETIAVDLAGGRTAYDVEWHNYKFSRQSLRELYDADGRVLYIDKRARSGGWPPIATVPDARQRYQRILPQLLLSDALENRATLHSMGESSLAGGAVDVIGFVTSAGDHMTLYIDRRSSRLRAAAHVFDMELLGDAEIRWEWSNYADKAGLVLPGRLRVFLDGVLLKDVMLSVELGTGDDYYTAPDGIEVGEPPPVDELPSFADFTPYSKRLGQAREIAPGVYLAPGVRPGFHMFFVEFSEFVLAVDAPTGWYEMQQIPPSDFARGEGTSDLTEKYIRTIKSTVAGKPIRYVALTHHHSDHIGGVRAFIAEGATILAGEAAAGAARTAARRPHSLWPDRLTAARTETEIEVVRGTRTISDGEMEVELIELPADNPKADGFLVVYLPRQKIMYFTSFIYPLPEASFPAPESVPLSLWFVKWLDQSGLEPEQIFNVHGQARVQDWQLERFREMLRNGEPIAGEGVIDES